MPIYSRNLEAKRVAAKASADRKARLTKTTTTFSNKTFEGLSNKEKDLLLKTIAIRLGLITDSTDKD